MRASPQLPRPGLSCEGRSKGKSKEKLICDPDVLANLPGAQSPDGGDVIGGERGENDGSAVVEKHARLRKKQRVSYAWRPAGLGAKPKAAALPRYDDDGRIAFRTAVGGDAGVAARARGPEPSGSQTGDPDPATADAELGHLGEEWRRTRCLVDPVFS